MHNNASPVKSFVCLKLAGVSWPFSPGQSVMGRTHVKSKRLGLTRRPLGMQSNSLLDTLQEIFFFLPEQMDLELPRTQKIQDEMLRAPESIRSFL